MLLNKMLRDAVVSSWDVDVLRAQSVHRATVCGSRYCVCDDCMRVHIRLDKAMRVDAWGNRVYRPFDGHGTWNCNNYECDEHPFFLYGTHPKH